MRDLLCLLVVLPFLAAWLLARLFFLHGGVDDGWLA